MLEDAFQRLSGGRVPTAPVTPDDKKVWDDGVVKAKYKIEVHFGSERSTSELKTSIGMLMCWESGRRFHGGGDQLMYFCGYDNCKIAFSTDYFSDDDDNTAVCPHCNRMQFRNQLAKQQGRHIQDWERLPVISENLFFRLRPSKLAELMERMWRGLEGDADIYLKYSPKDIRFDKLHDMKQAPSKMDKVRAVREPVIYPLNRIIKDTVGGADIRKRFLSLITA